MTQQANLEDVDALRLLIKAEREGKKLQFCNHEGEWCWRQLSIEHGKLETTLAGIRGGRWRVKPEPRSRWFAELNQPSASDTDLVAFMTQGDCEKHWGGVSSFVRAVEFREVIPD